MWGSLEHIAEDDVAVSTRSNANVFYEFGVCHASRKSVTVLINLEGTPTPFNILGMRSISL